MRSVVERELYTLSITYEVKELNGTFREKDYEMVRTELRHFSRNQLTIISILITAGISIYTYTMTNPIKLVVATGFIIPILIAVLGTLWIDQIYRQRELALYSFLLEQSLSADYTTKGWEHYVQIKRFMKKREKKRNWKHFSFLSIFPWSANYFYYAAFSSGLMLVACLSVAYSFARVQKFPLFHYSRLYYLGVPILIFFFVIETIYIMNIMELQHELENAIRNETQKTTEARS